MTMNSSGPISLAGSTAGVSIEYELGGTGTTQISLNCCTVRTLAGVPSGAITMPTNFYGKSNFPGNYYFTYYYWTGGTTNGPTYMGTPTCFPSNPLYVDSNSNLYGVMTNPDFYSGGSNNTIIFTYNNSGTITNKKAIYQQSNQAGNYFTYAVTTDSSGNIYTASTSGGTNNWFIITKLSSSFSVTWTASLGVSYYLIPSALLVDGSGNVYSTGTTNRTSPPATYLLKLTSSGGYGFFNYFYDNSTSHQYYGTYLAFDGSGNILAVAYDLAYYGYISVYTSSGTLSASYRYNYSTTVGSSFRIKKIQYISSSEIYLGVALGNSGSPGAATAVKLSSYTSVAWAYYFSTPGPTPYFCDVAYDSTGNGYFLTYTTQSGGTAWTVVAVTKVTTSGTISWNRYIYGSQYDFINNPTLWKIAVSSSGLFISGYIYVDNFTGTTATQNYVDEFTFRVPLDGTGVGTYNNYITALVYSSVPPKTSASITYSLTSVSVTAASFSPTTGSYAFTPVTATSSISCANIASNTSNISSAISSGYSSQAFFGCSGTYSWVAPTGVTSVSVVAVGGGAGGVAGGYGGGGGALAYTNNYSVTPGCSYTVRAGTGGVAGIGSGVSSYFVSTSFLQAGGGSTRFGGTKTGSLGTGFSGGNGGTSGSPGYWGGGAGGYAGAGGGATQGSSGSGGAGGGGGNLCTSSYSAGGGGGVGLFGQGCSGAGGGGQGGGGKGGSGGQNGQNGFTACCCGSLQFVSGAGGLYGGGGAGICSSKSGANGAVRIVWPGSTRQFPSTNVGNV